MKESKAGEVSGCAGNWELDDRFYPNLLNQNIQEWEEPVSESSTNFPRAPGVPQI